MIRREESLRYHEGPRPGKIEVKATKACLSPREMRLAYLPGALYPAAEIARDRAAVYRYTRRENLVGVITNGSAVPGLGDVGPEAAKPVQEGIALLFKRLADIDVFDLELDTRDPDRFVETVRILAPTFGGVNLKDLRAPEGLAIYERLREELTIPVFHENLYSTAVPAAAALVNALDLVEKSIGDVRVVISGAGTVGIGCARLLVLLGVRPENLFLYDIDGLIHPEREDLNVYQRALAREGAPRGLVEGIAGADVFLGASAAGVLTPEMVRAMGRMPIVLALATPDPEIEIAAARASRRDVIAATSRGEAPNTITDLLSFPYIFRGALDVQASRISEGMLIAASRALADLAREDVIDEVARAYGYAPMSFGPEYLLPKPIDPRILVEESAAVARAAIEEGLARRSVEAPAYQESLQVRLGSGRETLRQLVLKARRESLRVVFPDGSDPTILRACHILIDEGIARPILLGERAEVERAIEELGLDLEEISIVDPRHGGRFGAYAEEYFRLRLRRGVTRASAERKLLQPDYYGAMMLLAEDADLMIAGTRGHYAESARVVLETIGPAPGKRRISSHFMVVLPREVLFLADCALNVEPTEEDLAEIALASAKMVVSLGIEPRVAMLSFSNFGSVEHPLARRVRRATEILKERAPELIADGEMQLAIARNDAIRREVFPFCDLRKDANVLVFPDLQSGNLALHLLQQVAEEVVSVGPVLMGTRRPVHLLQYGASVEDVVHLTALGVVLAGSGKPLTS